MSKKILIVDDEVEIAQVLGSKLETEGYSVVLAHTGRDGLIQTRTHLPDVVLMDVNMPILNGIETTAHLYQSHPQIKVLALSIEEDENVILKMLRAGAKGYLMKDVKKGELQRALLEVIEKGFHHTNTVTKVLVESLSEKASPQTILKERELEFIKHACTEMTYKEIADLMFLSPKTIEGYRNAIFEKLNLRNRTGLVIYAIKNKIFVP